MDTTPADHIIHHITPYLAHYGFKVKKYYLIDFLKKDKIFIGRAENAHLI